MLSLGFLLKVSRPRFWIYLFGPYLIGIIAAAATRNDLLSWRYLLFGLYFLFPANLFVYGINDIFDYETDKLNPKKLGYETLVVPEKRLLVLVAIPVSNLPFLLLAPSVSTPAIIFIVSFLILSAFYSAPPIRAKSIPFVDSTFNILYIAPGLFAYSLVSETFPPLWVIVSGGLWTAAMHAFSAIPDINSDEDAGVLTIATELGWGWTLLFCGACYITASFICIAAGSPVAIFGLLYIGIIRLADTSAAGVGGVYRWFPYINAVVGFLIFCYVAWPKFF